MLLRWAIWLAMTLLGAQAAGAAGAVAPLASVDNPKTRLEIFAEPGERSAKGSVTLALRFTPAPGWHTYWKNFGDSGKEPAFEWTLPEGWQASGALYPLPHRIPVGPLMNYGYEAPQTLLVTLSPDAAANGTGENALPVELAAEWLVCEEICIPENARLSFTVPPMGPADPETAALFAAARDALPRPSPFAVSSEISNEAFRIHLVMAGSEAALIEGAWFYPLTDGVIGYAAPQALSRDERGLSLLIARPAHAPSIPIVEGVVVFDLAEGRREGFEIETVPVPNAALRPDTPGTVGPTLALWQAVMFALLGGMILNLMPCVFPVLSLKAFGLMKAHGEGEAAARRDGIAYSLGVLASFLAIALVFLGLRAAGTAVGWGFQLQMPLVVAALALLLFAVGLNLAGLYEIRIGALAGIGQGLAERQGAAGSFFTGVLATLVATPCTAPLMAPALGFAALQPDAITLAIFLALGFGLALPYLLIAFVPQLRRALPRPGPWMASFRKFLAWPMFLTALWLLWVLGLQAGTGAVIATLGAMMLFAFLFWPFPLFGGSGALPKVLGALIAVGLFAGLYAVAGKVYRPLPTSGESPAPGNDASDFHAALGIMPWSPERVAALRAEGRPVFVYFTAAWCITCKVNERVALADSATIAAAKAGGVAILEADWTRPDPRIEETLAHFGRNGVPLYLFYAPGAAEAEILPQVLLPETLIARFKPEDQAGAT